MTGVRESASKPRHEVPSAAGPRSAQHRIQVGRDRAVPRQHGQSRQRRQRPIRSTLTVLLVIPLVSLIALWAYAASSTVGGAIGKQHSDTANKVIGAPTQA